MSDGSPSLGASARVHPLLTQKKKATESPRQRLLVTLGLFMVLSDRTDDPTPPVPLSLSEDGETETWDIERVGNEIT